MGKPTHWRGEPLPTPCPWPNSNTHTPTLLARRVAGANDQHIRADWHSAGPWYSGDRHNPWPATEYHRPGGHGVVRWLPSDASLLRHWPACGPRQNATVAIAGLRLKFHKLLQTTLAVLDTRRRWIWDRPTLLDWGGRSWDPSMLCYDYYCLYASRRGQAFGHCRVIWLPFRPLFVLAPAPPPPPPHPQPPLSPQQHEYFC